jgi:hypothetical protein
MVGVMVGEASGHRRCETRAAEHYKTWLTQAVKRHRQAGTLPKEWGERTRFSEPLHAEMKRAVKAGECSKLLEARTIANKLSEFKLLS